MTMALERAGGIARMILPDGRVICVAGVNAAVSRPGGVEVELDPVAQEIIGAILFALTGGDA